MKVLVLGPNGQLGGDLVEALAAASMTAIPMGRDTVDVADIAALKSALSGASFDVLANCTSYHKTDEAEANATKAIAINAKAVEAMAEICAAKRARFLHVSTDYVFGGNLTRLTPLQETDPTAPVNVYGVSKLFGETLASLIRGDVSIFRVASLFGVRGASGKGGNFVETVLCSGREKGALKVVDDQIMSPASTAFVARAMVAFLKAGGAPGLYHCVNSDGGISWRAFAEAIIAETGVRATVTPCASSEWPTPAHRPRYSALDNGKLAAIIGEIPSWRHELRSYLRTKGHV